MILERQNIVWSPPWTLSTCGFHRRGIVDNRPKSGRVSLVYVQKILHIFDFFLLVGTGDVPITSGIFDAKRRSDGFECCRCFVQSIYCLGYLRI